MRRSKQQRDQAILKAFGVQHPDSQEGPQIRLRFRSFGSLEAALPTAAKLLIEHYTQRCDGRSCLAFDVNMLPPSVNTLYNHAQKNAGKRFNLDENAKVFRDTVAQLLVMRKGEWRPRGVTAAIIVFESATWVTSSKAPRKKDIDNKLKTMLDSIQLITKADDALHWSVHAFKLFGREERTHVWLFDIGDIIEASSERIDRDSSEAPGHRLMRHAVYRAG